MRLKEAINAGISVIKTVGKLDVSKAETGRWEIISEIFKIEKTQNGLITAQGMCIDTDDKDAIYTTQIGGGLCSLFKNGKVVKTAFKKGSSYVEKKNSKLKV